MNHYYRNLIATSTLPLDIYPDAMVANSLRKLSSEYTGSCIRVNRSNDNVEQDIGFINNFLDTGSLISFVGDNRWTYSQDYSQGVYVKTNTSQSLDAISAPDGTITADAIYETVTNGNHRVNRASGTIVSGSTYNLSTYIRSNGRNYVKIYSQFDGTLRSCILNLSNGTVASSSFTSSPTITDASGSVWWRFSLTINAGTTSTTNGLLIGILNDSLVESYAGDITKGIYLWGHQLVSGSQTPSYRATTATVGGTGRIAKWYDQSGNQNDSTMGTINTMPTIMSAGSLIYDPTLSNNISTQWNASYMTLATSFTMSGDFYSYVAYNRVSGSNFISYGNNVVGGIPKLWHFSTTNNLEARLYSAGFVTFNAADADSGSYIGTTTRTNGNVSGWKNNTFLNSGSLPNNTSAFTTLGRPASAGGTLGYITETIVWNKPYEIYRGDISNNVRTYYGIY